jgi:protein-S-isoprenylcysteine O-methyltransferase Ste14
MSLLKIPFILVSAIGIHISLTCPSPTPSSKDQVVPSAIESFIEWFLNYRYCAEFMKITAWAVSFVEVANILTIHISPSQIPEGIYGARAVHFLRALHPTPVTPAFLVSSIAVAIGGVLRLYCMGTLGKFWSFHLRIRKEHRLVTSGPYSVVRHPSYTGSLLQSIGVAVMYGSQESWTRQSGILQVPFIKVLATTSFFVFIASVTWVSIGRPAVEDQMLQHALGEEWEDWARRVKYRLIPGVY